MATNNPNLLFIIKKVLLFLITLLFTFIVLVAIIALSVAINHFGETSLIYNGIIPALILGVIQIIGMIGVLKEKLFLVMLYSILMSLGGLALVYVSIDENKFWIINIILFLVSLLACSLARDIRIQRSRYLAENPGTSSAHNYLNHPVLYSRQTSGVYIIPVQSYPGQNSSNQFFNVETRHPLPSTNYDQINVARLVNEPNDPPPPYSP